MKQHSIPQSGVKPERKEGLPSRIAGTVFAICLIILMIASTAKMLLMMFG